MYFRDTHAPVPYTPGASLSDSLLHNEDDDATQLRTQVAKLSRRVTTLEQENQRRSTRDLILYPVVIAYLVSKMFFWMFRSRHWKKYKNKQTNKSFLYKYWILYLQKNIQNSNVCCMYTVFYDNNLYFCTLLWIICSFK